MTRMTEMLWRPLLALLIASLAGCGGSSSGSANSPTSAPTTAPPPPPPTQCADGIDNDMDGAIDLDDAGCENAGDDDENDDPPPSPPPTPPVAQCADGIDNDMDGAIDLDDAGCENAGDDDESDDPAPPMAGLDQRPSNLTCLAPDKSGAGGASVTTENSFPDLPAFARPVALLQAPDDSSRWFVVEQTGRVRVFSNDPLVSSFQTFIDLRTSVDPPPPNESGLLGMAFHPDFAANRQVFLSYTEPGSPLVSVVSRFTSLDGGSTLDPSTQVVILRLNQDAGNHNGGHLAFGPDGYLYIGFGDGGGGGDPLDRAQDPTNLLGAMLRIDVDGAAPYGIPPDNPFAGNPLCPSDPGVSGQECPEIYAWGLRNPWRWSFDRNTGEIWLGDVGQNAREEVNRIERGGNYGWDCREGANPFSSPAASCAAETGLVDPVAQYDHGEGSSISGGYVYRGTEIPALIGRFVFADYVSSKLWALADNGQGGYDLEVLDDSLGFNVPGFGEANNGELYVIDFGGRIRKLVEGSGSGGSPPVAPLLSSTGCVSMADASQPADGLIPYSVRAPFWSDGATKERWLAVPDGTTITVDAAGDFQFPSGTVLMKHFRLGGELVETRLFMRHPDGDWAGYSYEWDSLQTDATLVQGGKVSQVSGQDWIFPSGTDCLVCHTAAAGYSLGLETGQLNADFTYPVTGRTANQLLTLDAIGMFSTPLGDPGLLSMLTDPSDAGESQEDRARAYLHSNCANCHRSGGTAPSDLDLRFDTPLPATNSCDISPQQGDLGIGNARLVAPGDPARSILAERMNRRDVHGMPPLASNLIDNTGTALIQSWIAGLSGC